MFLVLIVVSLLQFSGEVIYIRNTLLGRSQPNRVSFFLGAFVPAIAFVAGISVGETWALVPIFMVGLGPFLILVSSFLNPKAYWKLGTFDYVCGIFALLAIVLWIWTKEPALAVLFAILSDLFAWLPTLVKSWKYPETETGISYVFASLNAIVGIVLLESYNFSHLGFLAYTVLINLFLSVFIYRKNAFAKLRRELSLHLKL